jgi:putative transcriptional regulator
MEIEIDSVKDRINRDDMSKGTTLGKSGARKYVRVAMTPEQRRKALRSVDWKRVRAMTEEEIERNALDDPDSIVPFDEATEPQLVPDMPDVAVLRRRLKLSQAQFATRFGFSVATVRNWEQGRVLADGPARILLAVIANEPQAVIRALRVAAPRPKKKAA